MNLKQVRQLFEEKFNAEIASNLFTAFQEIESNFILKKWKPSELDAGHFVETVRRIIELKLFNSFTPFGDNLRPFNDSELQRYERQTGHESYRMLIPRILKSIYNIRNKRGVGHVGVISPNEMDATLILYSTKWILAELVRLNSTLKADRTQKIVDKLIERNVELIWKNGEIKRILKPEIETKNKVLILLYDESPLTDKQLQNITEYQNPSNFRDILEKHHKNRLIEYKSNGECLITPKGLNLAEILIEQIAS